VSSVNVLSIWNIPRVVASPSEQMKDNINNMEVPFFMVFSLFEHRKSSIKRLNDPHVAREKAID
jgi:hypothetical protein